MNEVEYRGRITVPDLPLPAEVEHDRLLDYLLADHEELGPTMTWASDGCADTVVILATDAEDEASAAQRMYHAVVDGLRASGLADRYPSRVEVEPADDLASA